MLIPKFKFIICCILFVSHHIESYYLNHLKMGVSLVLSPSFPENKSSQQVLESLYKFLETLGAKKCGTFRMDCETFASTTRPAKILQIFHDSDRPVSTFALSDSGICLIASNNIDIIFHTYLNQIYPCKRTLKIECCGQKFELCEADFIIRIGAVSQDTFVRGIVIEIEYCPCIVPQECWDILTQVALNFVPPNQIPTPPTCDTYKPSDMIEQYQQVFNSLRKST